MKDQNDPILSLINLEIDLMAASGFSIVLCVIAELKSNLTDYFITNTLKNHQFSEIHFNLKHTDDEKHDAKIQIFFGTISKYATNNGYIYIYTTHFQKGEFNFDEYKKQNIFVKLFFFSDDISLILKNTKLNHLKKPFLYCKTGFDQNLIRILLCNVPLYDSSNSTVNLIPTSSSGLSFAHILKEDFYSSDNFRVPILYSDKSNFNRLTKKYVDFEDVHLIRPDFYVKDTLYLTHTSKDEMEIVNKIQNNINVTNKNNRIVKNLIKSCKKFINSRKTDFVFHTNQFE